MPLVLDIEKALSRNYPILSPEALLLDGLAQMRAARSRCVLVAGDHQPIGVVTEADVIDLLLSDKAVQGLTLGEVLTTAPIFLRQSQTNDPAVIINYFQQHSIRALPVLDDDNQIIGVMTEHSLLTALTPDIRTQPTEPDNRTLLTALFEESTDAIFLLDPETLLTVDCNQPAVELFEASDKMDLIGLTGYSMQRYACSQAGLDAFAAALSTRGFWSGEAEYVTHQGKVFLAHIAAKSIRCGDSLIHMVRLVDLSARKATEIALQKSEERLDLILKFGRIGTWDWLVASDQLIWNETHYYLLGYAPDEIEPTYQIWRNSVHPDDIERIESMLQQALATQTPFTVEYRILPANNQPLRWVYSEGHGIYDEAGQVTRVVGLLIDINERKQAEIALQQSEARLRQAQQIAHFSNWQLDVATRHITWSDDLLQMFGFSLNEPAPSYAELQNYIFPDDWMRLQYCIEEASTQGTPYQIDMRILHPDGSIGYMEARGQAVRDQQGTITKLIGTALDITERKQTEQTLWQTRKFLDSIVENLPAMVFVKEAETLRFVQFNKTGETLLGISREELLGKNDYDFFPKEEADFFVTKDREVLAAGELLDIPEEEIQTRHQGARLLHTKKIPLLDEAGNPQYLLGISEDISERKQTETELYHAKEAAEAASRAKSEFLATMSHEIRTPMNAVIGMTSLLFDTPLTSQQQQWINTIRQGGEALLAIINDILDFSRIESGQLELEAQPFSVRECVRDVVDLLHNRATEKNLQLNARLDETVPTMIEGDVSRLRQILVNLVGNAIKFTKAGTINIVVKAAAFDLQTCTQPIEFAVQDTGIGIPEERLSRLFQPFSQVDSSITRHYGGTGLGLTISQRLCELMGGRINVISEVGKGSTFWFTLPVPVVAKHASSEQDAAQNVQLSWDSEFAQHHPLRILIAEDNPINQQVIQMMLQRLGYSPDMVSDGQETLDACQRRSYDMVLMDVQMPRMDGLNATRHLRNSSEQQPWIIGLSANAFDQDRAVAFAAGMNDYLAKPLRIEQLVEALRQIP
ncbi:MAG: PAS domain-containing protein [Candidatus Competibacteraceae bacterium]|jgi:PAS domain S-box-containing protein|nr:PAS domain-containing protein [Candidatus Competibacteraceae bacterium]